MDKVLKIGIIGCGAIGKDHCRRIIETVPGATVVAVSAYVAAAADETAAKYGIKSYGNDCDGMIKDPEVEAVVITSIDPTHHDYVMKTLAEEKWCFCEKPLSQNAKDCEEIIRREQEIGKRLVQVGFMRHYDRGYAEMKRIIASGELGKPLIIKACHRNVSQGPGFKTENGVTNVAIHELDICRWRLGMLCRELDALRPGLALPLTGAHREPLKLTLDAAVLGLSGQQLAQALRERGVECEYADPRYVVLMPSALAGALEAQPRRFTIREAVLAPQEMIPAAEAVGRICAAPAVSCPPAIPIVVSGETVPPEALPLFARYGIEKAAVVKE